MSAADPAASHDATQRDTHAGPTDHGTAAVARARGPRADLAAAVVSLEKAAAAPARGRLTDWAMDTHDALVDVGAAFERHIAVTEGPDGLLEQIRAAAPRLTASAAELSDEHQDLRRRIAAALDLARGAAGRTDATAATEVREAVNALLLDISRHRQAGSDLVFEAFEVDIGAGD